MLMAPRKFRRIFLGLSCAGLLLVLSLLHAYASHANTETTNTLGNALSNLFHALSDIEKADDNSTATLFRAVERGQLKKTAKLLQAGVDLNAQDGSQQTPLHVACFHGHKEIVELLLKSGADAQALCDHGATPLHLASFRGHTDVVSILLASGVNVQPTCEKNITPLHLATDRGHAEVVSMLLKNGAAVDPLTIDDKTPLIEASLNGHSRVAELLIAAGADVNAMTHDGRGVTPLHDASLGGNDDIVRMLVEHGANIGAANHFGETPLHLARIAGKKTTAALLVALGADPDAKDIFGQSPERAAEIMLGRPEHQLSPVSAQGQPFDPRAIVYIVYHAMRPFGFTFKGTRLGFVVGDGTYVLTAGHCVDEFASSPDAAALVRPWIISPYYGDMYEAQVIAEDEKSDVALLKAPWKTHPALEIEEGAAMAGLEELLIAGFPPPAEDSNSSLTSQVMFETLPLLRWDRAAGKDALALGGGKYVGPGWSGCPIINPKNGKAVGVFGSHHLASVGDVCIHHHLLGCDMEAIHGLFQRSGIQLSQGPACSSFAALESSEQAFRAILDYWDTWKRRDRRQRTLCLQEFERLRPDSICLQLLNIWEESADSRPGKTSATRDLIRGRDRINQILLESPQNVLTHATYASLLLRAESYPQALREIEAALALDPDSAYLNVIKMRILTKANATEAVQLGHRLVARTSRNPDYWFELAGALREIKEHEESASAAEEAFNIAENKSYYEPRLANTLANAGRMDEAQKHYDSLLTSEPRNARYWQWYAEFLIEHFPEKVEQGRMALDKCQALNEPIRVSTDTLNTLREKLETNRQSENQRADSPITPQSPETSATQSRPGS